MEDVHHVVCSPLSHIMRAGLSDRDKLLAKISRAHVLRSVKMALTGNFPYLNTQKSLRNVSPEISDVWLTISFFDYSLISPCLMSAERVSTGSKA